MVSYSISDNLLFNYEYDSISISFSIPLHEIESDEDRVVLLGERQTLEITEDSMEMTLKLEWGEMKSVIEFDEEESETIRKLIQEIESPNRVIHYPDGYSDYLSSTHPFI